ncbi:MAG: PAS domain-containing sensor histidine kinase [Myxococcota bacterium]
MAALAIAPEPKPELLPVIRALGQLHELVALIGGRSGEVLWTSDGLRALWGGRTAAKLHWLGSLATSEDAALGTRIAEGETLSDEAIRLVREDGTELPARISAARLAHDSACDATIAIFRLEDREEIAREFYHRVETLAEILDGSPDGVLVLDHSRFIRFANRALSELVGEAPEALIDRPLASLVRSREDLERMAGILRPEAPGWSDELVVHGRDGRQLALSVHVRRLTLADGTQLGAVIHLRDVTERRRIEGELARRAEELQHWVNAISHDLRSPLVAVLGFARLLREDYTETLDSQGLRFLQRIEDAGRTMESLVHDLLEFARIGGREPRRTHVDPRDVLLQLQAELKPRLEEARVSLRMPDEPPLLWCDRTQLYQVLSNLVGNAIDHMGPASDPCIDVDVYEQDDLQHLVVRDHGCGIQADDHDRIFEIFQTGGRSTGAGGTGIGLAVVRKVAESHGGTAWVESTPGTGSAFHVTFRLA